MAAVLVRVSSVWGCGLQHLGVVIEVIVSSGHLLGGEVWGISPSHLT